MIGTVGVHSGPVTGEQDFDPSTQPRRAVPHDESASRWSPQIERSAPEAFDRQVAPRFEHRVRYRIDATVLFPLFSIPLAHRENVGFASVVVRDLRTDTSLQVRAYELFATSFPDRARGLNRTGFIREAVGMRAGRNLWTAHFGALSSNPEKSRREVRLDADESRQHYTAMDGLTSRTESRSTEAKFELKGLFRFPAVFYDTLLPVWRRTEPKGRVWSQPQLLVPRMEPLGFLGIVQRSLEVAARDVSRGRRPLKVRYPFAHKGQLMHLAVVGDRVDTKRARQLAEAGVLGHGTDLHRLDYRIFDRRQGEVQKFRVWAVLSAEDATRNGSVVVPVAFEFKAKSFLRLHAARSN